MPSSHAASPTCTHERRPGTTVCLHCRQEARLAAAERRRKWLLRGTAIGIIIVVAGVGGWNALAWRNRAVARATTTADAPTVDTVSFSTSSSAVTPVVPQGAAASDSAASAASTTQPGSAPGAVNPGVAPALTATAPAPTPATHVAPPLATIITGTAEFGEGVTATRSDSAVTVSFDTPELRTRMPEKFERFLRATLPRVYGPAIEPALAAVPFGGLTAQGALLSELPTRGIHVSVGQGWTLAVFPETRPGQDGPLVVRYRSIIRKD